MALLDKYPFDLAALNKGDVISIEMLAQITGKTPGTESFDLAVVGVMDTINTKTEMTAKTGKEGIRILTDSEASEYNHKLFRQGLQRARVRNGKLLQVDTAPLSIEEQRKHTSRVLGEGAILSAIKQAVRSVRSVKSTDESRKLIPDEKPRSV